MRKVKLLMLSVLSLSLFACNMGDDTNSSDVQPISVTGSATSGTGTYSIEGKAVNCRINPGDCQVTLSAYSSSGNLINTVINYTIEGNASQQGISNNCKNSTGQNQSCSFVIYGTTINNAQPVQFILKNTQTGANATSTTAFKIGGGI